MVKILKCTCEHEFQDTEYGKGNRVHTVSGDGKYAYCTVCSPSARDVKLKTPEKPVVRKKKQL